MAQEITLEEIFADIQREKGLIKNPPLSFTTKQFAEGVGVGNSTARLMLKQYEEDGRVRKIRVRIETKAGTNVGVPGWQWITKEQS